MRWLCFTILFLALTGCGAHAPDTASRRAPSDQALPMMKVFGPVSAAPVGRSNASIAQDFMELTFELESGRRLPVLSRFERPITLRVVGKAPATLETDLSRLLTRLRAEAGLPISRVPANQEAGITIEIVKRRALQRAVPQAACFVTPRVSSWSEFLRTRRKPVGDWTTLTERTRMAIFIPGDVSPQEVRDCLHEELAQALGPVNDLYRLSDSVFNDDNFNTVLTSFDMLILRTHYAPELHSGMTPEQVAARLPRILDRLHPAGRGGTAPGPSRTPRAWKAAINAALSAQHGELRRQSAAKQAVAIGRAEGWNDNRMAFSLFILGRTSLGIDGPLALTGFLQAAEIYGSRPELRLQAAHVAIQMAAFALSSGQPQAAIDLVNANFSAAMEAQNAGLLATLLMVKAEALEAQGKTAEARTIRLDSLGWARYGFGSDAEVRRRLDEVASLSPFSSRSSRS